MAREVLVSAAVLLLAALGAERIDVLWVGKAGTFGLMVAYPSFLFGYGAVSWHTPVTVFAWLCAIPALVLAYIAAGAYVPVARRALAHGRGGRRAGTAAARTTAAGGGSPGAPGMADTPEG